MSRGSQNSFIGSPIAHGYRNSAKWYGKLCLKDNVTVSPGDIVEINNHKGQYIGIIKEFWEIGVKHRKQHVEIIWFEGDPSGRQGSGRELLITAETSAENISTIVKKVTVSSKSEWELEAHSQKSKAVADSSYYCQYGFLSRSQTKTKELNWKTFYTEEDRKDMAQFVQKIDDFVMEDVGKRLSAKLSNNLKVTRSRNQVKSHDKLPAVACSDSEESENDSEDYEESSEDDDPSGHPAISLKRQRTGELDEEDEDGFVSDTYSTPRTPKKRKQRAAAKSPHTPKRFTTISSPGSKGYRNHAPLEVSPLPSRTTPSAAQSVLSPHQLARQRLHVAEVPTSLPCREEEFSAIFEQVESAIMENESALIYVSGTPGTGKTATVREVIAALHEKVSEGELFPFKFVEINGMQIPDPAQAYSRLWETLTSQRVTPNHALSLLQTQFSSRQPSGMPCVVLMDELDQLTTTKQDVMYNFFQWPNMPNTQLIVVAVANTMDLPERTLAHKVSSRLGLTRIAFAAYTRPQLNEIIKSRLSNVDSVQVDDAAIDYASVRVSRVSGDARRALDICRRAFELAEPGFEPETSVTQKVKPDSAAGGTVGRITVKVMKQAFSEMTSSPLQLYLRSLSFSSKLFLKALMACARRSGLAENSLGDIVEGVTRISKVNTHTDLEIILGVLQPSNLINTARSLAESGIIYLEEMVKSERFARVRMKISESDVLSSWTEDDDFLRLT